MTDVKLVLSPEPDIDIDLIVCHVDPDAKPNIKVEAAELILDNGARAVASLGLEGISQLIKDVDSRELNPDHPHLPIHQEGELK